MASSWAPAVWPNNYTFRIIIVNWTGTEFHFRSSVSGNDTWLRIDGAFHDIPPASPSWVPSKDKFQPGTTEIHLRFTKPYPDERTTFEDYVWDFDEMRLGVTWSTKTPVPQVQCNLNDTAQSYVTSAKGYNMEVEVVPEGQERLFVISLRNKFFLAGHE